MKNDTAFIYFSLSFPVMQINSERRAVRRCHRNGKGGREGERLRETDGESGVGDLQRRAEEEGMKLRMGWEEKESQVQPRGRRRVRGGNSFAFRLDSTTRWRILPIALMAVEISPISVRG